MTSLDDKPVLISSSMTSLLVSHSLSKARIPHVMIGGPEPNDLPRLGESINENSSIDFWNLLGPEFKKHFFTKSHISLMSGDLSSMIQIANPARSIDRISCNGKRIHFGKAVGTLIHAERIGLDRELYHKVRASPHCTFIEDMADVEYDEASDSIVRLTLRGGTVIDRPRYVFDGTGPRSLVARAARVGKTEISDLERVVWTHYRNENGAQLPKVWWRYGTNLLRLEQEVDGLEGISWLIPLGKILSVGISVAAETHDPEALDKAEVMRRLDAAWARRGLDYRSVFPATRPVMDLQHKYFIRDRGYGRNWLLCGGAFMGIWFPSSAGLWTSLVAARLAPRLLAEPETQGRIYENTLRPLLDFHELLNGMIKLPPFEATHQMYDFWSRWLAPIPGRMANHLRILNDDLDSKERLYRLPEAMSRTFSRHSMANLAVWGFWVTRARKMERGKLVEAFPNYFDRWKFARRNFLQGWPRFLGSKVFVRTSKRVSPPVPRHAVPG